MHTPPPSKSIEREKFWDDHIRKFHASGTSMAHYAAENGFAACRLKYWVDKAKDKPPIFLKLRPAAPECILIKLPGGTVLRVTSDVDLSSISAITARDA